MAKIVVNPTAELPARRGDVPLTLDQLGTLGIFSTVKKAPAFAKFPGTLVLRHCRAGEPICQQGQPGSTAFYMLTAADLESLSAAVSGDGQIATDEMQRAAAEQPKPTDDAGGSRLATARLMVGRSAGRREQSGWRRLLGLGGGGGKNSAGGPQYIPNDGPSDINYDTREAPIFAGEVFGEMSCLTRQPRSATVVADVDCYALEFLRNILDQLRRDPTYKKLSEEKYRQRVLEGHLRRLSVFQHLSSEQFAAVKDRVELVEFAPGRVIWDEGDAADAVYVVRSGIVQVLKSFPWRLEVALVTDWPALASCLVAGRDERPALAHVWKALSKETHTALEGPVEQLTAESKSRLVDELNKLAKTDKLLAAKDVASELEHPRLRRETAAYPDKVRDWNELQLRRANRLLFDVLLGEAIVPAEPPGITRVLTYSGRGDTLGEIGLARGEPRSATCVAYSHPDADRESTDVELVRISGAVFREILDQSPHARREINELIATRIRRDETHGDTSLHELADSKKAESLGLLQGQKLMLIDLDRCTRCGDCVDACISTHDDGHSRLFLDGPRFGKYLIPSSCRQCRDPVCMIGCPVGSIQQGANGQIEITDWCIGCGVCARQCPYDSIQMHDVALIPSAAPGWRWTSDAAGQVGSGWMNASFADRRWHVATAPHAWGIDALEAIRTSGGRGGAGRCYFRLQFNAATAIVGEHLLTITSGGSDPAAFLNGQPLALTQDARQKKRGEFQSADVATSLRRGANVLAVSVKPPTEIGAVLLDARLDALAAATQEVEEKLVTEEAVVCDQCASLAGQRHACVYACPHEAAIRIDAWTDFPTSH
jgi:CRP-like cAMP-binding protein/Fe-S-cluster-containing hydrogenase component 2